MWLQVRQLLYAAALLDADQEPLQPGAAGSADDGAVGSAGAGAPAIIAAGAASGGEACAGGRPTGVASAAEGLAALRLHVQSSGRYGAGTGAFLLPCYGTAELPQVSAFLCSHKA